MGSVLTVDLCEIEFVPAVVDRGLDAGENFSGGGALAFEGPGVDVIEAELLGVEIFAQVAGLLAAERREGIVIFAGAGLAVADEVEDAHAIASTIFAAWATSDFTRWSKWANRSSVVWPRQ